MITRPRCSPSLPRRASPWPAWLESAPKIVAEAFVTVDDPLGTIVRLEPATDPRQVVAAMARAVAPVEAAIAAPAWLRPEQVAPFRRCVAALERHGGALLADPVGSGKTWIALAVAQQLRGRSPAVAIVPAVLVPQWRRTAARADVELTIVSHELVSRGRLPAVKADVILIDEAHRFREPEAARYRWLAPWLLGRRTLLLSGTPVVNRLTDLVHELLLVTRDDALRDRGIPSLSAAVNRTAATPALGDLVFRRPVPRTRPAALQREITAPLSQQEQLLLAGIERLALSRDPGIASLIRVQFCRALASSPAALSAALRQYLHLLQQARAATRAGRKLTRRALLAQLHDTPEQLLLWELLPDSGGNLDLRLDDAEAVRRLWRRASAMNNTPRLELLLQSLTDQRPTLVFTTSRATLGFLRESTIAQQPAWLSGQGAGIGRTRLPRHAVLEWFGPAPVAPVAGLRLPHLLLATDVAAEGLDLQRIARVMHWDLPWTAVRLDQREGRARRLGSLLAVVEAITFRPAEALDRRLQQVKRIERKRGFAISAGLEDDDGWLFRWRAELGERFAAGSATRGIVAVEGQPPGWLIAIGTLCAGRKEADPSELYWIGEDGIATDAPEIVVPRLLAAAGAPLLATGPPCRRLQHRALLPLLRRRLQAMHSAGWSVPSLPVAQRQALARLRRLGRTAAAERNASGLVQVERGVAWLGGGLRAGERLLLEAAVAQDDTALLRLITRIAPMVAEGSAGLPLVAGIVRVGNFRPCHPSAPCCSISTAPSSTASP